jgi:molybdenum cofactor cytidylyltransferase
MSSGHAARFYDLAAIVLAAGFSRRMGGENKLLRTLGSKPLISHALEKVAGLGVRQLIVVLGETADAITPLLPASATPVRNARAAEGMGASLAAGAAALDPGLAGVFVVLGDMPFVERADYEKLATAFHEQNGEAICVPLHEGRRGHPVLFPARCFPDLAGLSGDEGARRLFAAPGQRLQTVEGCSVGVLTDFDDPQSFKAFNPSPSGDG